MSYIQPSATTPLPGGLSLSQFLQTVLVGVSGITGTLVRPNWQTEPPKQPDLPANWVSFGINSYAPDANAYLTTLANETYRMQRQETLILGVQVYGAGAETTWGLIRDGFEIPQNREALFLADMGFGEVSQARTVPDFVNGRWLNRIAFEIVLRRMVRRLYPVLTFVSANGIIFAATGSEPWLVEWEVPEPA